MKVAIDTIRPLFVMVLTLAMAACSVGAGHGVERLASQISVQQAKLLASDGADFDLFGISVALSEDTALVGAVLDDELGTDAGAAYIFVRSGSSWAQQAKLTAADGAAGDNFGGAVAISADTAVVGAVFHDDVASDAGAAYVFVRSGTSWIQQAKLVAADRAADDQLGVSVAVSVDTVVVGSTNDDDQGDRSGSAYVFVRGGTSWTQQAKLTAADGATADQLGISVAVSTDTVAVGAFGDDDRGPSSGSTYVFARNGASWTQQAKLTAADGEDADQFGNSIALAANTLLVGANLDDDNGPDAGSAYVFERAGTSWTQQAKLTAADGAESDNFGGSVSLVADTALVGAFNDGDLGAASGSAYLFARTGASWTQQAKLTAADGASIDLFGVSVALSGGTALVGALGDDDLGSSSGSAYVFKTAASNNGDACTANAECGSGFCADGVCCDTACGGDEPNSCQACSVAAGAAVDGTCGPHAAGHVCRTAAGSCDLAETCTGASTSCPADALIGAGAICRAAAGACDVAESCTGTSAACPSNGVAAGDVVCRPAANGCDVRERCTGSSASCPHNEVRPNLSLCHGGLLGLPGLCLAGVCVL
jgi:FG-GAP repeat